MPRESENRRGNVFLFNTPMPRKSLSLTPLIDVVFILLLFFMLASRMDNWQAASLATFAQQTAHTQTDSEVIVIDIDVTGVSAISGIDVTMMELLNLLQSKIAIDQKQPVTLRPASETTVQMLLHVVDKVRESGVQHLSIEQ